MLVAYIFGPLFLIAGGVLGGSKTTIRTCNTIKFASACFLISGLVFLFGGVVGLSRGTTALFAPILMLIAGAAGLVNAWRTWLFQDRI
ncbi:hypothetical protein EH165_00565 [Nakamurella antarctica]|uniref:Uncharacterized protein n=1 Tax=Nakamurella antarctica TaxID=1902245 RepID=A0A3G8ZQQ5_9ACTN|nr:hypothetical protein [Nakamurella antarctica]AZI56884.1 hypothetical protein EH165_00565 [Nakamurella antarctica]